MHVHWWMDDSDGVFSMACLLTKKVRLEHSGADCRNASAFPFPSPVSLDSTSFPARTLASVKLDALMILARRVGKLAQRFSAKFRYLVTSW